MTKSKIKFTKLYIVTDSKTKSCAHITFLLGQHSIWINKIWKIGGSNWIAKVEYDTQDEINKLIGTHKVRGVTLSIHRIFKSIKLRKNQVEPSYSFLDKILILISARLKTKTTIRVVNNKANDWQKMLLKRWQEELDNPTKFKKLGIKPSIDIVPNGKMVFHINKVGRYIITYFDEAILEYSPTQRI